MGEMLIPSDLARSSRRRGVPGVSSPMMIDSRRRSSAASAMVRWRIALSTHADPEPHLIRCQTRERINLGRVARDPGRPLFSVSQVSTLTASFGDDIRTYADAGLDGIGIWETKLDDASLEQFRAGALGAA